MAVRIEVITVWGQKVMLEVDLYLMLIYCPSVWGQKVMLEVC